MAVYNNMLELIGKTPMVQINQLSKGLDQTKIFAKLEYYNPANSVKDRIALGMIEDAEKKGLLKPGDTIVEPTSGNTGIGLAFVASLKGYKLIIVMPEHMSNERKILMKGLGASLFLTPAEHGVNGAINKAIELTKAIPNAVMLDQFNNLSNSMTHYSTTAEEIWHDTEGKVDIFVSGAGTGGTISGIGLRLKELNPNIEIVAVEPAESAVLSGKGAGPHKIQGIGAGFIPSILDRSLLDDVIAVPSDMAIEYAKRLMLEEGILAGISSGANMFAALELARRYKDLHKTIVFIACDSAERYLSTELFAV
ncbi:cysteine synthase A [Desulfovibrio litoralis]|uniref:Cysteine synthase n=1 Tax=Desulfovibrio litoralis DSM 11393 TaxID=1121455 RepID=A0A1M7S613_9BACT|nr:cysteine synthase A [Desulfovibrio litoralis]SHN53804.1 cysteine synthase A [Desulfovibrio litoralis DSM 11393]